MSAPKHGGGRGRPRPGSGAATPSRQRRHPRNYVRPDDGRFLRRVHRWQEKHSAKKARIAAMPMRRRVLRRSMIAGTWLLGFIAAIMVVTIVLFYTLTDVPRPESLPLPQKATIEYSDGSTLATIGKVDRTVVPLSDVPKHVRYSVLAAEDRGFYTEHVVSIKGTLRAALSDVTGGDTQGGSGITQQYVKNAYLNNAQTISRKLKELMIAVKLSREYTKNQILGFYLNTVYFGRGAYGIQAAAQAFFGENAKQLTVSQGALLAGLLRAPSYYDPASHPNQARDRWNYVLQGLVATGHLSKADAAAQTFPKTKPPASNSPGTKGWKYLLTNEVLEQLRAQGITSKEVYSEGMTIRTTINKKAQLSAVDAETSTLQHTNNKQRNLKSALVAVNPHTGGVLAYYGGTGPGVKGLDGRVDFNDYASQGSRPPGSTMKPYVLATALTQTLRQTVGKAHYALDSESLVHRCQRVEGTKICNDPGDDDIAGQTVTLADALKYSLNTVFDDLAS
ncbi:transglycosylase domain-containing protein, partial [Jatrophihabitans endophyticus]|uniref:transglycosylase domain-containing protein n=1 Tax=Jatrophihabitans endophyticus TaxID=1206085 RepID=UPI0019E081E9